MNPGSIAQDSDTMGQLRAEQALLEMAGRIGNLQGSQTDASNSQCLDLLETLPL